MSLKKNDIKEMEITGMTAEGNGVGRLDGMAVFVPASAPGDMLLVRVVKILKNYAFGKIEKIIKPAQCRMEPGCSVFHQCGGCAYRHIRYEEELLIKEQRVRDVIARIAGLRETLVQPILRASDEKRYRNKAQLPFAVDKEKNVQVGFYALHSHRVVACNDCMLQPKVFCTAMDTVKQWAKQSGVTVYNEESQQGCLRHLYLRLGEKTKELMVCIVANQAKLPKERKLIEQLKERVPGLCSVVLNINCEKTNVILGKTCRTLWGRGFILDELCSLQFALSPLSFYQVNRTQAKCLYRLAAEYAMLNKEDVLLDLYCGTGTIGLSMAHQAKEVIGVEVVPQAVENAKENAKRNGIENARFLCADAAKAAQMLQQQGVLPQVIVIDPPRKGCAAALVDTIVQMHPKRVVYVSCDPATLARDLKLFSQRGYQAVTIQPVDMFPRTAHVECVAWMQKL